MHVCSTTETKCWNMPRHGFVDVILYFWCLLGLCVSPCVIDRTSKSRKASVLFFHVFEIIFCQHYNFQHAFPRGCLLRTLRVQLLTTTCIMRKPLFCTMPDFIENPIRNHEPTAGRPTSHGRNHTSPDDIIVGGMGMSALARSRAGGLCRRNRFAVYDHPCHIGYLEVSIKGYF